ncbi:MAG: hypothetical protein L3J35_01325 [Bacteroidales bacterium]|nr:hypothetical protein [Bacteroidales bacterium]
MKNIIIIAAAVLISVTSYAQIKLSSKLNSNTKVVKIDENNYKSYNFNSKDNTVQIFNLDNTLWKTVTLNIPEDAFFDEILHISNSIINKDEQVEIVYTTYKETYSDVFDEVESIAYENYNLIIINEKGEELLNVKGGISFNILNKSDASDIIIINTLIKNEFDNIKKTLVYSIF